MAERYLRQSALAHLGLDGRAATGRGEAGVRMAEAAFRGIVDLRGKPADARLLEAFETAFGFALPVEPNTSAAKGTGKGRVSALWLGPDEWWVIVPGPDPEAAPKIAGKLRKALAGRFCAVTEVGESRACIRVSGPRARDLLQKGSPLDFHPRAFGAGGCAQSHLAKAAVVFHQVADDKARDGPAFEIYVPRSFAEYLWRWLEDAAREYGVSVVSD
ncbi:MAG: sarcosine oxidase subunit gamma [Kiloniellaceae bacterium]